MAGMTRGIRGIIMDGTWRYLYLVSLVLVWVRVRVRIIGCRYGMGPKHVSRTQDQKMQNEENFIMPMTLLKGDL